MAPTPTGETGSPFRARVWIGTVGAGGGTAGAGGGMGGTAPGTVNGLPQPWQRIIWPGAGGKEQTRRLSQLGQTTVEPDMTGLRLGQFHRFIDDNVRDGIS
jgi:hypothetical protein